MNDFEESLLKLQDEGRELQKDEVELQIKIAEFNNSEALKALQREQEKLAHRGKFYTQKLAAFFKEHGLPENFTFAELGLLAIRKSRGGLVIPTSQDIKDVTP